MRRFVFCIYIWISFWGLISCNSPKDVLTSEDMPPVYPDYTEITIPCNIAPLNFMLRNNPEAIEVQVKGKTTGITIRGGYKIQFTEKKWRSVLEAEKGNTIAIHVTAKINGQWIQYAPFHWFVVADEIDPYISYRLIEPGYEVWNSLQLRERSVENFEERIIADNNLTENSCMNCHMYGKQNPQLSAFHLRGKKGGTILNKDGQLRKLNTQTGDLISSAVYGDLHPSGRYGVFSGNIIIPAFHTYRSERLEVYDTDSDIELLDFDKNEILLVPYISKDDTNSFDYNSIPLREKTLRTFPVFSADGNAIYYCDAPRVSLPDSIHQLKYSLYRMAFDPVNRSFGTLVDTLYSAATTGKSVCHPKASPDGKYLLYTVADYGTFPIWHQEADLQLLNLQTGETDDLKVVNSDRSDTYHSWSSNSRWFVFASKRDDGLYGKPYFCYIDKEGNAYKPFVLPQRDPAFYDYTLKSFNIPELSKGALPFGASDIEKIYYEQEAEQFQLVK